MPTEEIGLECEIILAPEADQETVLTEIYYQIGRFLSPMVQFRTLTELLTAGKNPGEIFDGHLLKHGFIADEALIEETDRQHFVFTSDLVRIMMNIPGVYAINDLGISGYVNGRKVVCHAENCLALAKVDTYDAIDSDKVIRSIYRKPQLTTVRSVVTFSRDEVVLEADQKEVYKAWNERMLRTLTLRVPQVYAPVEITGDDMQTNVHQSIQNDLPVHFGTTQYGMSDFAPDEHKGKVKQLKGFLLFFDQMLANYLSQLNRVRELFSFRDLTPLKDDQTYFVQNPDTVPYVEALLEPFMHGNTDWQDLFDKLQDYAENDATRLNRRNIFLSHIAARFAESFSEYAAKQYAWEYKEATGARSAVAREKTDTRLIPDKKAFLLDYPRLSGQRGKAFCVKNCHGREIDVWDTHNVEGMKRRLCRLIGIADDSRRYLTGGSASHAPMPSPLVWNPVNSNLGGRWRVLIGTKSYVEGLIATKVAADHPPLRVQLTEAGANPANYEVSVGTKLITIYILRNGERIGKLFEQLPKVGGRNPQSLIDAAVALFLGELPPKPSVFTVKEEGLHIIEHILFRPLQSGNELLKLPEGEIRPEFYDPYSFRVTVILPRWAGRFSDPEFGAFVEHMVRMEMPAHVHPWVIWVDDKPEQLAILRKFEEAYKAWLEASALPNQWPSPSSPQLGLKQIAVVKAFNAFLDYFLYKPLPA